MLKIYKIIIAHLVGVFALYGQSINGFSQNRAEFFLLGTIHDMHMKEGMNYSLHDLRRQIEVVKPDLISIEIEPKAFNAPMEGYFPPEAAYIAVVAKKLGIRVVPTDWRIAKAWQDHAEKQIPQEMSLKIAEVQKNIQDAFIDASKSESIYDFAHNDFQKLADKQFCEIIGENNPADISMGAWRERNRRIIENTLEAKGNAKRILIIYGAAHLSQLSKELYACGYSSKIVQRSFKPTGISRVPKSVIIRWQRNLENLLKIKSKKIKVAKDDFEKINSTKRIDNLKEAIEIYGK